MCILAEERRTAGDNAGMSRTLAWTLWMLCAAAPLAAVQVAVQMMLDPRAIGEAIAIGQTRVDADRARFHRPYRLPVNKAPIDFIEVVTPFRRVALHAQSRARIGDRSFGQRQALELLNASPVALDVWVELTFHPQNNYVGVPAYEVSLIAAGGARIPPRSVERVPRYGPRVEEEPLRIPVPGGIVLPGGSQPLLGGTVMAQFDGRSLNASGTYDVVIVEGRNELARVRVDLAKLR